MSGAATSRPLHPWSREPHDCRWPLLPPAVARRGPSYIPWLSIALGWQLLTCRRPGGCERTPAQALAPCGFLKRVWALRRCGFQNAADKLGVHNIGTSARLVDHVRRCFVTDCHDMRAGATANMFAFTHSCNTTLHSPQGGPWPPSGPCAGASFLGDWAWPQNKVQKHMQDEECMMGLLSSVFLFTA